MIIDDFEDGDVEGWITRGSTFSAETAAARMGNYGGRLVRTVGQAGDVYYDTPIGTDEYTLEGWLRLTGTGVFTQGYIWANADIDSLWSCELDQPAQVIRLKVNGVAHTTAQTVSFGVWYKMTIKRFRAGNVRVFLDDVLKFDVAQSGTPTQYIGMHVYPTDSGGGDFDDITVTPGVGVGIDVCLGMEIGG